MSQQDETVWQQFIQSVKPLKGRTDKQLKSVPPRLRVHKAPEKLLAYELDLHGFTVDEAYQCLKMFIATHVHVESRVIRIITGKGIKGTGKIKNEIMLWLETPAFRDQIRETHWLNDGGVLEIVLKRKRKNDRRKNSSRD